jgi:hypothetical protein
MLAAFALHTWSLALCPALLPLAGQASAEATGAATIGALPPPAVARLMDDLSPKVERWRGERFRQPVGVRVIDAAEARRRLTVRLTQLWPEDRLRADNEALRQLGLLPPDVPLLESIITSIGGQISGFYDPPTMTLFLLDAMPQQSAPLIVAHELTHALDDQHHQIDAMIRACGPDDDRVTALSALIEGSAMLATSAYVAEAGLDGTQALAALTQTAAAHTAPLTESPLYVQRSLIAPYLLGQRLLVDKPQAVDLKAARVRLGRAFADPPVSTEQLIHPEKYWDLAQRDLPRAVTLRDASPLLGKDWTLLSTGTLGELMLAVLTGAAALDLGSAALFSGEAWTNAGAAGWGGDLYHHYSNGRRSVTLLATVWDTPADAREFEAALRPLAGRSSLREDAAVVLVAGDCRRDCDRVLRTALRSLVRRR